MRFNPEYGVIHTANFWLNSNPNTGNMNKQILNLLNTLMEQNYFQYDNHFYKPHERIAMGSPISGMLAELYLLYIENDYINHWSDSNEIIFYRRYVDGILIVYSQNKIKEDQIFEKISNIDKHLKLKMTTEENGNINFLDLTIHRGNKNLSISIYRKATNTDTTNHYLSNNPYEQKMAAYRYYIHRMLTLHISQTSLKKEWTTVCTMAISNGFPEKIIHNLKKKLTHKKQTLEPIATELNQKWVPFTFFGPAVRKITNLFKSSNIKIAFRTTNTIQKQLSRNPYNQQNPSGIYSLKCNTCNKKYVGQTGRGIDTRYKEHICYTKPITHNLLTPCISYRTDMNTVQKIKLYNS